MTKEQVKQLRSEINDALKTVGDKHNLTVQIGRSITYDDAGFTARIEGVEVTNPDDKDAVERAKFERDVSRVYGVEKDDFHRSFSHNGTRFKLVGVNPKAKKYPIIGKNGNGTRYKFPLSVLQHAKHA